MDIRLALMAGIEIPIPECQLILHQPTIKEIAYMGETEFFQGIQYICLQKNMLLQDESLLSTTSNFQIFMMVMQDKTTADKKASVISVLSVLFPDYNVMFTPRSLVFTKGEITAMVDETNFESLQQIVSQIFCLQSSDMSSFNPGSKRAKEIADKLMKARQKVAQQKAAEGEGSVIAQYLSTITVGIGSMSLNDCLNLTMYQLYDLIERYSLYINWDIDLRSRMAGAKGDKPMDNWMKNIH